MVPYGTLWYLMVPYGTSAGWKSTRRRKSQPKHRWGTYFRAVCPNSLLNDKVAIIPFTWCASYFRHIFSSFFRAHLHGVPSTLFVFVVRGCMTDVWWLGWSVGRSVVLGESVGRSCNQPLVMGLARSRAPSRGRRENRSFILMG